MEEKTVYCDICNLPKPINDGEWDESFFRCNDCLFDPDYSDKFNGNTKIKS
jgi:hypothetical protein